MAKCMKFFNFSHSKKINLIGITLSLFLALTISPLKAQKSLDAEECTKQFFETIIDKNVIELSAVLAMDFTITGMDGRIIDRETFITSIKNGYISVQTGIVDGIRVKNYLDDSFLTSIVHAENFKKA